MSKNKKGLKKAFVKADDLSLQHDKEIFNKIKFGDTMPSPEDSRDFIACAGNSIADIYPDEYRAPETEILNQGSISSCVAHACVTAMEQGELQKFKKCNNYSRGYIYGNRRSTDTQSDGMVIRQALKQLNHCGDVFYNDFPYNKAYPKVKELIEQDKEALAEKALPHAILEYVRCREENQIKKAVMQQGSCIICVPVYTDFARDLHVTATNKLRGYHAMAIIGWLKDGRWIVQNSWGEDWGYNGLLLMDKDYPVNEYWSIFVNDLDAEPKPMPEPVKQTWFQKLINWVKTLIKKLLELLDK